ncbi:SpoIIE family protein phosphatase [Agaribacter flavus]|uniref:SpoIIE family protein phosphatase n=1 Tax=Agaribacter flavus TaxID=1902781 RepID=A0ABV7FRD5_9ALTE
MRILIIEDDALFAEILQRFLEDKQCNAIVCDSIASAKQHLNASRFQFILLDNHLPDGDGINAIQEFKQTLAVGVPIVMVTAEDNQITMSDAFERGADDFLMKPVSLDLLWQKIQRVSSLYKKDQKIAEQTNRLKTLLDKNEQEEQLARYVYEHIASTLIKDTNGINPYLQSSSSFNGDIFISEVAPNGNHLVFLADATGHGLAAAISILPLVTTIKAMIRKGLALAHILHEANAKLCNDLPDDKFVALIGIEINFNLKTLSIFNGGMPDLLAIRHDKTIDHFSAKSMALGILAADEFDPALACCELHPYKNLLFFSDGIIEQRNADGEEYGMARLIETVNGYDEKEPLYSRVINYFTVFNEMRELEDDVSVCDVAIDTLLDNYQYSKKRDELSKSGKIRASLTINGGLIGTTDLVGCFDNLMRCTDTIGDLRQRAFTVFAELISNALDHGILGLDSKLKDDYSGFAEYIELKEERLTTLGDTDVLDISYTFDPSKNEISFSIKDSGTGYDTEATLEVEDGSLSGRGLSLIQKLCTSVEIIPPGNQTTVQIKREF